MLLEVPKIGSEWAKHETWRSHMESLGFEYVIDPARNRRNYSVWRVNDIKVVIDDEETRWGLPTIMFFCVTDERYPDHFLCKCRLYLAGPEVFEEVMLVLNGVVEPRQMLTCVGIPSAAPILEHFFTKKAA